jgi:hypothetical protein
MKIGEYATTDEIMNQSTHKWVVLVDLDIEDGGAQILGGMVKFIEDTKAAADKKTEPLYKNDVDAIIISGLPEEQVILSGVLVE